MKYIAPVIITLLMIITVGAYFLFIFGVLNLSMELPFWVITLIAAVFFILLGCFLATLIIRIKELKKEDINDYSKY